MSVTKVAILTLLLEDFIFNKEYDEEIYIKNNKNKKNIKDAKSLIKHKEKKLLTKLSLGELLTNLQKTPSNIIDDLVNARFKGIHGFIHIFKKDDRLYYLGILLIIISFLFFLFALITNEKKC